jgi:hypothetical protein
MVKPGVNCGCCPIGPTICTIVYTDDNSREMNVLLDDLRHIPDHPLGWASVVKLAGWKDVDTYHSALALAWKDDLQDYLALNPESSYLNRVLLKSVYDKFYP